ncbi:MAG: biotin--[acetyl-CoA-carboxylase] ligase [Bacteroidales bacterium]|jgi:biotin-[acetyl-CoA-carboxylase] ligase BirA-like protein|nr:biotin--[acetyl-CoA-carboxylase] ligase [Bacteroidales bacterium]
MLIETLKQIDIQLLLLINGLHTPFFDTFFNAITNFLYWIPFFAVVIGFIIKKYKSKTWIILLFFSLSIALTDQGSNAIKKSVKRYRPSHTLVLQNQLHLHTSANGKVYRGGLYSFVSSHAANSFGIVVFLIFIFAPITKHAWWIFPSWALLFSYSRMYLGVHYPSDILAGALLGISCGLFIVLLYKYLYLHRKKSNNIIYKEELPSTNAYLWKQIAITKEKLKPFTLVYTDYQTAGRGQQTNTWESEKGKNLLMSILLYPPVEPSKQFLITEWISLSIADFLINTIGLKETTIKWPNDIYVNDKKIAGILVEHSLDATNIKYSIAGIGLNMNQDIFPVYLPNPTSLKLETQKTYPIEKAINTITNNLQRYMNQTSERAHDTYLQHLYKRNTFCNFRILSTGEILELEIKHVLASGLLQVKTKTGDTMTFNYNEIQYQLA